LLRDQSNALRWWIGGLGAAILAILIVGTWYAGRQSAIIQGQGLSSGLNQATQQLALTKLQLDNERAKRREAEKALNSGGNSNILDEQARMRRQILELQAEIGQYKAIMQRQERALSDNLRLLTALSTPGAHLFFMKGTGIAANCTAYALVVENSEIVLIASNVPKLDHERQFQFWVVRKDEPKIVSAGMFTPDDNRVVLEFEDPSLISNISLIQVTDEPRGGSSEPTGPKLLFVSLDNSPGH
jgi:Anti-sigma-K factor rskA